MHVLIFQRHSAANTFLTGGQKWEKQFLWFEARLSEMEIHFTVDPIDNSCLWVIEF